MVHLAKKNPNITFLFSREKTEVCLKSNILIVEE